MDEPKRKKLTYASLCDGIGAVHVAWKALGWTCAWTSEIEPYPAAVVEHHHHLPNLGDMTKITEAQLEQHGPIDLLVGGTPCQSFSVAGLRKGLDDPRGNLALRFCQLASVARPRWVLWENVPGVLSSGGGRDFFAFLRGMAECGYFGAWRVLDAQYFGLAQRRKRVFALFHLGDWRRAAAVLFERESLCGHPAPSRETGQGVAHATSPCIGASGRGFERAGETRGQDPVVACYGFGGESDGSTTRNPDDLARPVTCRHGDPGFVAHAVNAKGGSGRMDYESETFVCGALTTKHSQSGHGARGSCVDEAASGHYVPIAFPLQEVGKRESKNQNGVGIGIGSPNEPMYTLQRGAEHGVAVAFAQNTRDEVREIGGNIAGALPAQPGMKQQTYLHSGMAVRRLTPRECERLQGYPDDYTLIEYRGKLVADGPRYRALGNSMAVPVMRWLGERILEAEHG